MLSLPSEQIKLVKFLIKKEEYFLRKPETIPAGFVKDWL